MDLSGTLTCSDATCQKKRVDRLFGKVWHYFDQIVVDGLSAHTIAHQIENTAKADRFDLLDTLWQQVNVILYLREIGADKYLIFQDRDNRYCAKHGREYAKASGLEALLDDDYEKELVDRIHREADIDIVWDDGSWLYHINHPALPSTFNGYVASAGRKMRKPTKRKAVENLVSVATAALASDLNISRELMIPLAQETDFLWSGFSSKPNQPPVDVPSVALRLPLPVIHGLPARDVVKLREDERPHFDRFQAALKNAIREQISRDSNRPAGDIARDVQEEFIRPALADIERSLKSSKRVLAKKTSLTLSVGSVAVTVGALTSVPLMLSAGVGAAFGMSLSGLSRNVEETGGIEMSDVYFLWKAQRDFSKH